MTTVTEPTLNEILHVADCANCYLESIEPEDEDQPTDFDWSSLQKVRDWAHALENLDKDSEIKLALAVLEKHGVTTLAPDSESIEKMLTVSTAHITQDTAEKLNAGNKFGLIVFDKGEDGWWFYVSDHASWAGVPDDLKAAMAMAKDKGCVWLCLDQDAVQIEELQVWDW